MFAVIKTGGKQYKVTPNAIIKVEKLEKNPGDKVEFTNILVMGEEGAVKLGSPLVPNTRVCGTVLDQIRDDKVIIFKKNRRHNYRRKNGHRQYLTVVKITDILPEGAKPSAPKAEGTAKQAAPKIVKEAPKAKAAAAPSKTASAKEATPPASSKKPVKAASSKASKKE